MTAGRYSFFLPHATLLDKKELERMVAEYWKMAFTYPRDTPESQEMSQASSDTTAFPRFARLPMELQEQIWAYAAHVPLDPSAPVKGVLAWRYPEHGSWSRINLAKSELILVFTLDRRMRNIPLFWVCRAARRAATAAYGDPQKGDIIFNTALDSVCIRPMFDDRKSDRVHWDECIYGPEDSDIFDAEGMYSDSGVSYPIARCPLPSGESPSRELYHYTDPSKIRRECFRGDKADHRFYGISKSLQRRIRHIHILQPIHALVGSFSTGLPIARGIEAAIERFPDAESLTIDVGDIILMSRLLPGYANPRPSSMDAPEWWTSFILTLAEAGRPIRLPEGIKRISFTSTYDGRFALEYQENGHSPLAYFG